MTYELVTTLDDLARWQRRLDKAKLFAIDTETTGKDSMACGLVGVCLSVIEDGNAPACYIPVGHTEKACKGTAQLPLDTVIDFVDVYAADRTKAKIFQNAIYDLSVLGRYGIEFANVDDTMVMSYALTAGSTGHGMDELADAHLGHRTIKFHEVVSEHELLPMTGFQDVALNHATHYAAEDTEVTLRLYFELRRKLKARGLWHVYEKIDRPLIMAGADMKRNGIAISSKACARLTVEWSEYIEQAATTLQQIAPGINVGSTKQVSDLLFDVLGLPVLEKTDSGAPSTGIETLELLRDRHEAVDAIVRHRKYSKLVGTYSQPLPAMVNPDTKRLHTNLNFCTTNTGRLSSSGPNLQNIPSPAKGGEGVELRRAFIAPRGYKLIAADYSQIELRVLAHITQDPTLLAAYHNGEDIHAATARTVFQTDAEEAGDKWAGLRRFAKTINFGLVYGMTSHGLSHQLKIDEHTAQEFIDRYFHGMPGVAEWMEREKKIARDDRFVHTLYGRRLYLNEGRDRRSTSYAERQGPNYKIQGSAADLIRIAMADVRRAMIENDLPANLLLQVHDELLIEAEDAHAEEVKTIVADRMCKAGSEIVQWRVPILVDAKIGSSWAEAH